MLTQEEKYALRYRLVNYLRRWYGVLYKYGGNDPGEGFDCSGIIHETLQACGLEPRGFDSTAQDLYLQYKNNLISSPILGALVFWFKNGKAQHIEMITDIIGSYVFTTGASGGKPTTITKNDAILHNAYIKDNVITYREPQQYKIIDILA